MRRQVSPLLLAALLAVPVLSGCLSFAFDDEEPRAVAPYDPGHGPVAVEGVRTWNLTASGFGNTSLAVRVLEPTTTQALPDGSPPTWPVVVFVHGWGGTKESWQSTAMGEAGQSVDLLDRFARAGFLAVAYDARGFGQSGGSVTVAGPAEMADLSAVIDFVEEEFRTSGRVGVTGTSYGGGHSFLAWAKDPRIDTAVPHQGWVDLPDALVPGNVPKLEWAQALYGLGLAGSAGRLHPMVTDWYTTVYTRAQDPASFRGVQDQMDLRSMEDRLPTVTKPLFVCHAMHDTLFPQADRAWQAAGGFVRAYVHNGGHGTADAGCWDRTLDWFLFFLRGEDTQVDRWPALVTTDARDAGASVVQYRAAPPSASTTYGLREPDLTDASYSGTTFAVEQRLAANPFQEPAGLSDLLGRPPQALPEQIRQDPTAVTFRTRPFEATEVVLGAPELTLVLAENASGPFQVTASLYVEGAGASQVLTRAAFAALDGDDVVDGKVVLRFHWVKATLEPGDVLVLKVGANDPSWWMPLLADYAVTFTGESRLDVPLFAP